MNMSDMREFLRRAAHVKPSARQLSWYEREFYAFVHFSPNTYTGLEWGLGNEDERIFNPVSLDCDQWVEAVKSAGMRGLILTAKHHDGFCLWPSAYTEHCVKNSPVSTDVVKAAADACRRGGIAFGVYLSPWDRNCPLYGSDAYNDYYKKQLTELLTGYGELFCVWLDGACGEGPNGRKQEYDFEGYLSLVRRYQPNAVMFGCGPDVRWVGNEAGLCREAEWAVVPRELFSLCEAQTGPGPAWREGENQLSSLNNTAQDIGGDSVIARSSGLCFRGAEVDMSIRPGWFYHPQEEPHSLERLMQTYLNSVGHNACFNLNIPPMPSGLFDPRDVRRLKEFGAALRDAFSRNIAEGCPVARQDLPENRCVFTLRLPSPRSFRHIAMAENIAEGQRVVSWRLEYRLKDGPWLPVPGGEGATIGHKEICRVGASPLTADGVRLTVTEARDRADDISLYLYE